MSHSALFTPFRLRGLEFQNRIGVSPMCQYSAQDGFTTDWHLSHLGARAVGGPGLVMVEATAVVPEGRISSGCVGLWDDAHIEGLERIVKLVKEQGSVAGIQIGHAGRKASSRIPWNGSGPLGENESPWRTVAPSAIPFDTGWHIPHALTVDEIKGLTQHFAAAARRALVAGFEVIEIHAAHGYLLNEFLSPLTNQRTDEYGGKLANRSRFLQEVITAIRSEWPEKLPLFLRISASDWVEGGWTIEDSVELATLVKPLGVDLIDCSSGGVVPHAKITVGPGYQVPFADAVRNKGGIATAAVGMITDVQQVEDIIASNKADMVFMAREFLRNPLWPIHAAQTLGATPHIPRQYARAF